MKSETWCSLARLSASRSIFLCIWWCRKKFCVLVLCLGCVLRSTLVCGNYVLVRVLSGKSVFLLWVCMCGCV
jgi:hypothetical protein